MSEGDINVVMKILNSILCVCVCFGGNEILVFVCVGSSWTTQNIFVSAF